MKNFLVLYCATQVTLDHWKNMTPEAGKAGMEEWMQWQESHKDVLAQPGNPAGKNTRITSEGGAEVSNEVCGYSVVTAESKEEVSAILADNPHLKEPGTYLEVMELMKM